LRAIALCARHHVPVHSQMTRYIQYNHIQCHYTIIR